MPSSQIYQELEKLKQLRSPTPAERVMGALVSQQTKEKQLDKVIDQALVVMDTMLETIKELEDKLAEK